MEGRSLALKESGRALTVETEQCPHLVALSTHDALATGIVLYYLHEGLTVFGLPNSNPLPDIEIAGDGVVENHCAISYDGKEVVKLIPQSGTCLINGKPATGETELVQGQLLQLGEANVFRVNNPAQALKLKKLRLESGALPQASGSGFSIVSSPQVNSQ